MKKITYLLLGVAGLFVVSSCQDNVHSKNYNDFTLVDYGGLTFIKSGLEGGLTEIKTAKLAKANSSNQRVIRFADEMINDHAVIGAELRKIRDEKLVDPRPMISSEHQELIASLSSKKGADFDKAYMEMMVEDHENAIALFNEASRNTSIPIEDLAKKTLPTLHMHLDSAKSIYASLK